MSLIRRDIILGSAAIGLFTGQGAVAKERRPDLADAMAGNWFGDVISDSQGSEGPG